MRVQINLATRPFVELRPFFARLRLLMALLVLTGIGLGVWTHAQQIKLDRARAQMDALRTRTDAVQTARVRSEQRMRQPANAAVLNRAHFLNALFLRKSFSWTAVMMDLENVLPIGVQVTSIEPQVTADGDVVIRLRVSGERDKAVQLVRNLERSHRFRAPRLTGETTQAKENAQSNGARAAVPAGPPPGVQFEILADYNPLPVGESYGHAEASSRSSRERQREAHREDGGDMHRHSGHAPTSRRQETSPPRGVRLKPYEPAGTGGAR